MPRFICILSPGDGAAPLEPDVIDRHRDYLQSLLDEGTLVGAGPLDDPPGEGLLIYNADDRRQAIEIAETDPVVLDGGQLANVRQWTVAFGG